MQQTLGLQITLAHSNALKRLLTTRQTEHLQQFQLTGRWSQHNMNNINTHIKP